MSRMLLLGAGGALGNFGTISDTFDRADSAVTLGNTETGQAWVAALGTWGISSSTAYIATGDGGGSDAAYVEASEANVRVKVVFSTANQGQRLIGRYVDADNFLFVSAEGGGAAYALYKRVAGTNTSLGSYSVSVTSGDEIWLNMTDADDLKVYLNGNLRISANDAAHNTATKHGLGCSGVSTQRWNNFSIEAAV